MVAPVEDDALDVSAGVGERARHLFGLNHQVGKVFPAVGDQERRSRVDLKDRARRTVVALGTEESSEPVPFKAAYHILSTQRRRLPAPGEP